MKIEDIISYLKSDLFPKLKDNLSKNKNGEKVYQIRNLVASKRDDVLIVFSELAQRVEANQSLILAKEKAILHKTNDLQGADALSVLQTRETIGNGDNAEGSIQNFNSTDHGSI
jgi:hypothetical protein